MNHCPICNLSNGVEFQSDLSHGMYHIHCPRCGVYEVSDEFLAYTKKEVIASKGYILSSISRELYITGQPFPTFFSDNLDKFFLSSQIPDLNNPKEKALHLVKYIKESSSYYGDGVNLKYEIDYPIAYAKNSEEFIALIKLLVDSKLIVREDSALWDESVVLTAEGWDLANQSSKKLLGTDQAFVAIWFDNSMSDSTDAICKAIADCGYRPMCIKNEHFSERIMDKALGEIKKSKFMVVDLSGNRSSVFFEAGFGFGLGLDIIYTYKKEKEPLGTALEFYVKHYQCIGYDTADELGGVLIDAIRARIK